MVEVVKVWSEMLSFAETEVKDAVAAVEAVVEDVVQDVEAIVDPDPPVLAPVEEVLPAADPASGPPAIDPA